MPISWNDPNRDLRSAAYHEARHGVVALALESIAKVIESKSRDLSEVVGMEITVTDEQWKRVADKMSRQGVMGRPRADDRRCLNAILYVLITGCR